MADDAEDAACCDDEACFDEPSSLPRPAGEPPVGETPRSRSFVESLFVILETPSLRSPDVARWLDLQAQAGAPPTRSKTSSRCRISRAAELVALPIRRVARQSRRPTFVPEQISPAVATVLSGPQPMPLETPDALAGIWPERLARTLGNNIVPFGARPHALRRLARPTFAANSF